MNFSTASKKNREIEQRIQRIVDLSRRRDQILGVAEVDLDALAILTADYEATHMHCIAAELRRKLNWYQGRSGKKGSKEGWGKEAALVSRLAAGELMPTV
jgi:hypothetical protein